MGDEQKIDRGVTPIPDSNAPVSSGDSRHRGAQTPRSSTHPAMPTDPATARQFRQASEKAASISQDVSEDGHRFDTSHIAADSEVQNDERLNQPGVPPADMFPPDAREPSTAIKEDELFLQASQLAEHLRGQVSELDRREQSLNEQMTLIDRERRNVRLWSHQFDEESRKREENLKDREVQLTEKIASCEQLVSELENQEAELQKARDELTARGASLRDVLGRELEVDRESLKQSRLAHEDDRQKLDEQIGMNRRALEAALADVADRLETERKVMRQQLLAELESERSTFEQEQKEWSNKRDAQQAEIAGRRKQMDEAARRSEEELKAVRVDQAKEIVAAHTLLSEELEAEKEAHQIRLGEAVERCELEMAHKEKEWLEARDLQLADIERMREEGEAELQQMREDGEAEVQLSRTEIEEQRTRQDEQLKQHKEDFEKNLRGELQTIQQELHLEQERLKQERTVFENRIRFQQDHLQKTRGDIETTQREFRIEQQSTQQHNEISENLMRLRSTQLAHYRELLGEREASLERQQQLFTQWRGAGDVEHKSTRERLRDERQNWDQERLAQSAELRRQQDMLELHAENLEGRRERLDQLRAELEETHSSTLEMRIAVEEAWAQLTQAAGAEATRERIDESRSALSEHYRQVSESLKQQGDEIAESRELLDRRKQELTEKQQSMADWIEERDSKIRVRDEHLAAEAETLEERESVLQDARDHWMHEKLQAEEVIRDLLGQLAELANPESGSEQEHIASTDAKPTDQK